MASVSLLSKAEQQKFDSPPSLKENEIALFLSTSKLIKHFLKKLRNPTSKVGFLLQYVYFKKSQKFFTSKAFKKADVKAACRVLKESLKSVDLSKYQKALPHEHRLEILRILDFKPFDEEGMSFVREQIQKKAYRHMDLRQTFLEVLDFLLKNKIEVPSYYKLAKMISGAHVDQEEQFLKILDDSLSKETTQKLDALLIPDEEGVLPLNRFKVLNQSLKTRAIQKSVDRFCDLKDFFEGILPLVEKLNLSPESASYYATWVKKARIAQLTQFAEKNKQYLHFIAFIQDQFYRMQDNFLEVFIKCVQASKNSAENQLKALDFLTRGEKKSAVKHLSKSHKGYKSLVEEIKSTLTLATLTDLGKLQKIAELISAHEINASRCNEKQLTFFEKSLASIEKDQNYFDVLEKHSRSLQQKLSGILRAISFNSENSDRDLMEVINAFKVKDPNPSFPRKIFTREENKAIGYGKDFKVSLYKILMFFRVAAGIKAGALNLKHSYQYLSIQDYLIDDMTWMKEKNNLLRAANLESFSDFEQTIESLKPQLHKCYVLTNKRLLKKENPYLFFNKKGSLQIKTPPLPYKRGERIANFLEDNGYVSVLRVLSEISSITKFTDIFKHHNVKYAKARPSFETFIAGIVGLGCNIGASKMAQISTGIRKSTLLNTVNWYFKKETLLKINKALIKVISKLELPNLFINKQDQKHGSSDGQKFVVGVDSLMAGYSHKYFGKEKGVVVCTFIDERQALFHLLVHKPSERESTYVSEGLLEDESVDIDMHSTDTHGYTEAVFAATHFYDVFFAPRIKNVTKQAIYGFYPKSVYKKKGYKILPTRSINLKLIKKQWENILRFMTSLKLKESSPSQLFKRLSSYAKDHPLYRALKEFGRIIKSIFILTYYNDVELRQRIEKQLSRIEHANRFSSAVFYANNKEFKCATKEEQEIATACRVIIQNAIVLWNYLYISQILTRCSATEKDDLIKIIKKSSIMAWAHVNLQGEFDFKKQAVNKNSFDMKKILALDLKEVA